MQTNEGKAQILYFCVFTILSCLHLLHSLSDCTGSVLNVKYTLTAAHCYCDGPRFMRHLGFECSEKGKGIRVMEQYSTMKINSAYLGRVKYSIHGLFQRVKQNPDGYGRKRRRLVTFFGDFDRIREDDVRNRNAVLSTSRSTIQGTPRGLKFCVRNSKQ